MKWYGKYMVLSFLILAITLLILLIAVAIGGDRTLPCYINIILAGICLNTIISFVIYVIKKLNE